MRRRRRRPRNIKRRVLVPRGLVKIRHYGFMANCKRSVQLARCRELLSASTPADTAEVLTGEQGRALERRCPLCGNGVLRIIEWLSPAELLFRAPEGIDSS